YLDLLARSQVCKMETADAARDVTEKQLASSQAINRAALYVKARDIITTDRPFLDKRGAVLTANPPPKYSDVRQQFFVVVRELRGIEVQEHGQSSRAVNLKATEDALEELSKLSSSASSKPPLVRLMD